jgi:tetratricopeptide (TPR) repeat protein
MKTRRSPLAVAAAAVMAAPPVSAQPMQLTPPAQTTSLQQDTTPPAATPLPPFDVTPDELRGLAAPLPEQVDVARPAPQAPPQSTAPSAPSAAHAEAPTPTTPPSTAPTQQAAAAERLSPAPTATVSVGARDDYTRLVFRFAGPTTVTPLQQGERLDLRFSRAADLDIAELRATPPRLVREVRRVGASGTPVRLQLTLERGVRQRHFVDGDRVVVDLLPPEAGTEQTTAPQSAQAQASTPTQGPVSGAAHVQVVEDAEVTRISVAWPAPVRAAAFRRGEAIWLLFDAAGSIDLGSAPRVGRRHRDMQVVRGEGVLGLRIPAPPDVLVSASASQNAWVFTLGARADAERSAELTREISPDGRGRLTARFQREGVVRWIADPEIGDRIAVGLIGGPALGVDSRRATVEAAVLPAAHGAVVEPRADGVVVAFDAGVLSVTRGDGLITAARSELEAGLSAAMIENALGESDPSATQPGMSLVAVRERIDELTRRAAAEGVAEGAPVEARMALARFLLENEFAAEALGALRVVAINQRELVEVDPEFRLMRGAANVMMGRVNAALQDLNASRLADNASAALWRGYAAALQQDWALARQDLERGVGGLEDHPPAWRARFQLALARAAFELNDHAAAEAAARAAMGQAVDETMRLQARLIEAQLAARRGDSQRALAALDELARETDEEVAVRAGVEAIRIRRASGVMRAVDAVEPLEALRFRWRGDSAEIAIVSLLGEVYSELGRWRDALATMRVAADRFSTDPASRQLRADMATLFERLFLDGEADRLEPIQALGLFYEFSDLTPVGPNGDRIVRLLAGRLVHVDLLEQAAQLLQHQVDERLEGPGKARVAADLAAIYLMDRRPDRALVALASSRLPNMSADVQANRRILEARALLDLGRLDGALELVERDRSEDAQRVRAEAAWRARDWTRAAAELRTLIGMRDHAQPLDSHARQAVLRAGVALTLAGDDAGVRALYREHAGDMAGALEADAFEVIASGVHADGAAIRDVARAVARTDLLDRFMQTLRARMTEEAAASQSNAAPAQPSPPAPQQPPSEALPARAAPEAGA